MIIASQAPGVKRAVRWRVASKGVAPACTATEDYGTHGVYEDDIGVFDGNDESENVEFDEWSMPFLEADEVAPYAYILGDE